MQRLKTYSHAKSLGCCYRSSNFNHHCKGSLFYSYTHPTSLIPRLMLLRTLARGLLISRLCFSTRPLSTLICRQRRCYGIVSCSIALHVTKPAKLFGWLPMATEIATMLFARKYAIASSGHLMMANTRAEVSNTIINKIFTCLRILRLIRIARQITEMESPDEITGFLIS